MTTVRQILFTLFAISALAFPATAAPLRAGAAKVSITPSADVFPFPYDPARSCEPAFVAGQPCNFVGVHDPIYARALILTDGERSVVIVLVEATAIPDAAALQSAIAREAGVPVANVLLAASHTHEVLLVGFHGGTPNARQQREIDRIKAGALAAVRDAKQSMRPARLSFARGMGWINVNNGDSVGTAGYNPAGPTDKSLDVIKVDGTDGQPIGMLVNYASHAEVMYRSVTRGDGYEVSGDIPGRVSATLEKVPAMAPVVLFSAGAEGDQQALFKAPQHDDGPLAAEDQGAAGWAVLNVMVRRLSLSVIDIVKSMPAGNDQARIDAARGVAICPGERRSIDPATRSVMAVPGPAVSIPLSVIRINDIALAGVGGDVGSEIGMAVKRASPIARTTLVTVTAGSVGYVLADSSYARPSHGILGSPLKQGCAQHAIVDGLDTLIASLWRR